MLVSQRFPRIETLMDHRGRMALVDELVAVEGRSARCRASIRSDNPFLVGQRLPNWALLEYIAQTVAAYAGYIHQANDRAHHRGLLLGCRNLQLAKFNAVVGDQLELFVEETAILENLGSFGGKVWYEGLEVASGTLLVYESPEWPDPAGLGNT
jgi:predicted hotdog family 3-hydroxylacyl-ACP dehydratase